MSAFRGTALGWTVALAAVLLMGVANTARAIGLGEARVDSYLNQPLDLRIRLLDASETELDSLTVGPATPADYQRLGVGSSALALDLAFEVDRSVSPAVIRITSSRPVADPIVQLLVDARWSSGRMLREYTLFLDPPTLDIAPPPAPARSEPRQSAPARPSTERPARQALQERAESAAPRPSARAAQTRDGGQRMVRSGDTLWSIARANLPAGEVSMNQMMVAIVELNPQAFRNGNIHQMLRGSRLELPDAAQAQAVDRARAAATVQAQNRAFNRRLAGDVPVVSDAARGADESIDRPSTPDPAPSADPATAAREPEPEARLELVPSTEESTGSGLEEDGAEVDRLRQQLARTEEELFAARLESEEFRSRLTDLEALVEENPNGVGIGDAELAGLEQTLRAARLAASEDADPALREEVTAQLDGYLAQFESAADVAASTMDEPLADAPDPVDEQPVTQEPVAEEPVAEEPVVTQVGGSDRAWWSGPLVLPLAGLIVLVILIAAVGLALRRRRREADAESAAVVGVEPDKRKEPTAVAAAEGDPVDRARNSLAAAPGDLAAHLALLQALASDDDPARFSDALEDMFEHVETGAEPSWREALELAGRVVPGHVLVKGSADWMSSAEGADAAPLDELDEESEVGDLMSRLESEPDEETDDRDWIDEPETTASEPADDALPGLHDDEDERDPLVLGGLDEDESVAAETGTEELTAPRPDVPDEEDAAGWMDDDLVGDGEADDAVQRAGDATDAAPEPPSAGAEDEDEDEDDRLVMDWTESSDDELTSSAAANGDAGTGVDIFAPSDDDVDVKLDLARAYLSWNSTDSAKTLLEEVVREGNDEQKEQAQKLLDDL